MHSQGNQIGTFIYDFRIIQAYTHSWLIINFRFMRREANYISVFNMGTETEIVHLHHSIPNLPPFMTVAAASVNSGYQIG